MLELYESGWYIENGKCWQYIVHVQFCTWASLKITRNSLLWQLLLPKVRTCIDYKKKSSEAGWSHINIGQLKGIFPQVPKPIYYFVLILKMKKIHLTSLDHSLQHIPQCSWDFGLLFLLVCMFFSWSLSRLHRMPSIWTNCPICSNGHAFFWYSKIAISCLCIFEVLFPVPCCGQSKSIRHWTFKIGDHSKIT